MCVCVHSQWLEHCSGNRKAPGSILCQTDVVVSLSKKLTHIAPVYSAGTW